ncbi:fimbria/pilus outer membrane usher protein [Cupriavidus campinensis]|jgi:outer membrane usher protein
MKIPVSHQKQPLASRFRLRPTMVSLALFTSASAWADGMATPTAGEVAFNDIFLHQPGHGRVDVSRFSKGNAAVPGTYRADLHVNEVWLGRTEVVLRQAGAANEVHPCFDRALLERIGVDLAALTPEANALLDDAAACPTLAQLVPDAVAHFDSSEQRLDLSLPQVAMSRQPRGYIDPKYWDEGVSAGRLLYNASVYHNSGQGFSATQGFVGLNGGVNAGAWRFRHNGSLTHHERTGTRYQATQTFVQRSLASIKSQLVFGDAYTDGTMFDSVGFRGVQLSSDDRMYPESQRGYAPVVHGIASSNARVEIRQNGNTIYETNVAAGAFEINDLYPTGYGGDLEVVVTEADGSVHISKVPYAGAVNALRPGVTRYGVAAGQYRSATSNGKPLMMQATVQHGFTNLITGFGGVTVAQDYASGVIGAALNTRFGALGADITHASTRLRNEPDRHGQSVRLSLSKLVEPTNTNLTLAAYRYSTGGYLSLADAVALGDLDRKDMGVALHGTPRGRLQLVLNQALPGGYGNFYVSGSTQDYWRRNGRDTQFQLGYNNSFRRVNYGVSAARQFDVNTARWNSRVMLSLGVPLGKATQAPYSTTSVQTGSSGPTSVNQSVTGSYGVDNAFSYGLNAGYTGGGSASHATSVGGNASYQSTLAAFTGGASKSNTYTQASAGISGGVVAYSGGVVLTPSLGDTLAIVEAKGASGARVGGGNGLRVDPWGRAVVSSLMPFARNEVEIDPKGLPLDVELKSTLQQLAPTAGAIVKVLFETANPGRAAIVRVRTADGKPVPFGGEVLDAAGESVGMVGQGGRIIVRGLQSDSGELTVASADGAGQACQFSYRLPALSDARNAIGIATVDAQCL